MLSHFLFLEPTDHNTHIVVDMDDHIISENTMPDDAIRTARQKGYNQPIKFGSGLSVVNSEETIDYDNYEVLISDLCFALKKRVVHIYDENLNFKGWKMEARE